LQLSDLTTVLCRVALAALVASGLLAAPAVVQAQGTSVEELERRLQKAKEERVRRDAAAARERETAEAERKRKEAEAARAAAERKAQEARLATLVVQTDAACTFMVNGKEAARLAVGINEVKVAPGQMLVSCASSEEKVAYEGEIEGRSGQSAVLRIALAGKVAEIRSARAAAQEREAQARRQAEERARAEAARLEQEREKQGLALAAMNARLQAVSSEVLFDSKWGLQWTRSDNGSDVTWAQAQSHCRGLGGGWSLPTVEQLQSLYDAALPGIRCGSYTCKVSDHFRLSSYWFWSSESNGFSGAWFVDLDDGRRVSYRVGDSGSLRALCVRRP